MGKKIDIAALKSMVGTLYPPPFDEPCRARERMRLGDAAGLAQFGVNSLRLPPGAWSSQRRWHAKEDDVLVTDAGEEICFRAIARASRAAILTGAACKTEAMWTRWYGRLARASRMNPLPIRTLI